MPGTNDVDAVVDARYRPTFRFLLALVAVGIGFGFAVSKAQEFVDARINAKILAGNAIIETQGQKLEKLDTRVDEIRGAVMEIKADVRVLRETVNR